MLCNSDLTGFSLIKRIPLNCYQYIFIILSLSIAMTNVLLCIHVVQLCTLFGSLTLMSSCTVYGFLSGFH